MSVDIDDFFVSVYGMVFIACFRPGFQVTLMIFCECLWYGFHCLFSSRVSGESVDERGPAPSAAEVEGRLDGDPAPDGRAGHAGLLRRQHEALESPLGSAALQGSGAPVPDGAGGAQREPARDTRRPRLQVRGVLRYASNLYIGEVKDICGPRLQVSVN